MEKWGKKRVHEYNSSYRYVLRHNIFFTVNFKLPPVIWAPRGCCGHASGIFSPSAMVRCVCTSRDSVLCHQALLLLHAVCRKSYIFSGILARFFNLRVFAGCFRMSWSNGNKRNEQQPTKNTPRGRQTSYRLDYSLKR